MSDLLPALACCSLAIICLAPLARASSEAVLYSFSNPGGSLPSGPPVKIGDLLYGTTLQGGTITQACEFGCGSIFSATKSGAATTLYGFKGGKDGSQPNGGLADIDGTLYGTTYASGNPGCYSNDGCGTVFSITPNGTENVVYSFKGGADGSNPVGALVSINGTLYGTTFVGGARNAGTVFSVTPGGVEEVIYSFKGGRDGSRPAATLIASGTTLYGTTSSGGGKGCGGSGCGTVFSVTTVGRESVLHRFKSSGDGAEPYFGALLAVGDRLFGTTYSGGSAGAGTVFSITKRGHERVLYSFTGGADGASPEASLIKVGNLLYGLASGGGSGYGTTFSISPGGAESLAYSFAGGRDGSVPQGGLLKVGAMLYGVTRAGGASTEGTLFKLTP